MARDKWGYGPHFPGCKPERPTSSLRVSRKDFPWVVRELRKTGCKLYEHLPNADGSSKVRIYSANWKLTDLEETLIKNKCPFDIHRSSGSFSYCRFLEDGRRSLNGLDKKPEDGVLDWVDQDARRSLYLTLKLITQED